MNIKANCLALKFEPKADVTFHYADGRVFRREVVWLKKARWFCISMTVQTYF